MSFNIADFKILNDLSEITQMPGVKNARSPKTSFLNVFFSQMPDQKAVAVSDAKMRFTERKAVLNDLLEKLRAESDARRQDLYSMLIKKDEDDKPFDITAKCMEIARRIMRGEKVSAEEMRLLGRYFPELLFQALLLKQEKTGPEEKEIPLNDDNHQKANTESSVSSTTIV